MGKVASQDRALGAILGLAVGDALGAPHEFQPPLAEDFEISMSGGNGWEPGEWTDDTAMAIAIILAWRDNGEFGSETSLDSLVQYWVEWSLTAKDIGNQTREVLGSLKSNTAAEATSAAETFHHKNLLSAGNGSLMRTAPLALLEVDDETLTDITARVSFLTHYEADAAEACIIWVHTIREAIRSGTLNLESGLNQLNLDSQTKWREHIAQAEAKLPVDFENNGWVVSAFCAALSAVFMGLDSFEEGINNAVKCGWDTDTVAAIAGSLLGAILGFDAIPKGWVEPLHGWRSLDLNQLCDLVQEITGFRHRAGSDLAYFDNHSVYTEEDL